MRPVPIFLFSLPRSGSTLAQRILAAHEPICTTSEPWILLPYLYTLRENGIYAEYNHLALAQAVEDFCVLLPGGNADYVASVREFVLDLYDKVSPEGTRYFLDKTPRYHLISDEIVAAFPDAKFIFLWRNPLAIVASIMETWADGKWNLYRFKVDLFDGLDGLLSTYEKHANKACSVRYETLVSEPEAAWTEVFSYLDLTFDRSALELFKEVSLQGRKGDQPGRKGYTGVSSKSLESWRSTLNNPVRKAWCRRYLRWIGAERLATMGYDLDYLVAELDSTPTSFHRVGSDVGRGSWGLVRDVAEPKILRQKLAKLPAWNRIHVHR